MFFFHFQFNIQTFNSRDHSSVGWEWEGVMSQFERELDTERTWQDHPETFRIVQCSFPLRTSMQERHYHFQYERKGVVVMNLSIM